ncbi:MAG TPA: hypothetical protein VLX92_29680 [Kofleriaceae bacterium]|nr:hypothetical protein [Kofleriaceae bacterium]
MRTFFVVGVLAACGGGSSKPGPIPPGTGTMLAGCPVLPADHIFNTPIDTLPVDPSSDAYIATIGGSVKVHLDLGTDTDQTADDFYGIPYNVVNGSSLSWTQVAYKSTDPSLDWDPTSESDCADASKQLTSPCTIAAPYLPVPTDPIVEGGIDMAADEQPYGDHHLLVLDSDACRLWEAFHVYEPATGTWNIFGSASWDLRSDDLRPADWTSADAAGFPILPLLLKADEASSGTITHALRFTIESSSIRDTYIWPARHEAGSSSSTSLPEMGQAFRLKASYQIPAGANVQATAILTAMKTYGIYIADGGSSMYVTGEPSASWEDDTFTVVQAVHASDFEAVDMSAITGLAGFDPDSGAVPQ